MELYGHPFSSYTWKAQIAFHAAGLAYDFRMVDADHPDNAGKVAGASPRGLFPLLVDGTREVFEATAIIEYLAATQPAARFLIPADPSDAVSTRMLDRVFDNYIMHPMQQIAAAHDLSSSAPDPLIVGPMRDMLAKSYAWLDRWLATYRSVNPITLIECGASSALFYADWVYPIPMQLDRLRQWRAHLLRLPPVARCVDEARPYRSYFPLGAPDRD